ATMSSGKISVPVSNYSFFAQFRHFTPVPASAGDSGFSIARLRVLDILLDRLTELQSQIRESGMSTAVGGDAAAAGKLQAQASELRALAASSASAGAPATRRVVEQLLAQYSATFQATVSASRQRVYSPSIPKEDGSAVIVSTEA
ncbi:MAG TPA: hypothetical protein VMW87_10955, partial [Spirochaetia bacterium]|nr:hypothetical protein [Spirochaetia bacterium]